MTISTAIRAGVSREGQAPRPLIGLPSDRFMVGDLPFLAVGEKYVTSLIDAGGGEPVILPAPSSGSWPLERIDALLNRLDGLLFPGSITNVEPHHYGGPPPRDETARNPARDALSLPLLRRAIERAVPVFAICRGFQELNVALGGSLHQHVEEVPDTPGYAPRRDHREPFGEPVATRYGPAHDVTIEPGGVLASLIGPGPITVNSLHGQGIDSLAPGLKVEARSPDGIIEAASMPGAPGFLIGVQWHPDYEPLQTNHYAALFAAFCDAARLNGAAARPAEGRVS